MAGVPDFEGLLALVGRLLLRWGWLEDGLEGRPIPVDLQDVRLIRNALCHRMIAAHADPHGEGIAYVSCRLPDGSVVRYSSSDLEKAIGELEAGARIYRTR